MKRFGCDLRPANYPEGGWFSLLALLLTVVIISILAVYLLRGPSGLQPGGGVAGETGGRLGGALAVRDQAKDVVCRNNLQQLRLALQMAGTDEEGNRPATLEDLAKSNPGLALTDPVGGEPYQYDPTTGRIWCIHPGHEKF
jgi:hypothetical protein